MTFYSNGQVSSGYLGSNQMIGNATFTLHSPIDFYINAQVKQGNLYTNQIIDGGNYNGGNWIRFNNDGSVYDSSGSRDTNFNTNQ